MSVSAIRSRFSTHQSAIFSQAQRDAVIFVSGCVACPLWTPGPRRVKRLSGRENLQRRVRGVYEFTA
jgi:hypothetical protein